MRRTSIVVVLMAVACGESTAPSRPNVRITTSPELVASFMSLGGVHDLTALVTDTLGASSSEVVTWDVVPSSAAVTVDQGMVTVAPSALPGEYRVRASALGVSDTTIVRVLPRPSGKLVFTAMVGGLNQVFVKDFAIDGDAVQITNGASASGGLGVDGATGTIVASIGTLPNVDLFRMNTDGSGLVNLTNNLSASNQGPTFNRATGEIYFSRRGLTTSSTQIFRMQPDGSSLAEVTSGSQGKVQPAISPDGLSLSWSEQFPGFNGEIVTSSIDGATPVRFTDRAGIDGQSYWLSNSRVAWSGALTTAPDVFAADAPGGTNALNLTNGEGSSSQPSAGCSPGTITILRRIEGQNAIYQFDMASKLAVKYTLPVERVIGFARRVCE